MIEEQKDIYLKFIIRGQAVSKKRNWTIGRSLRSGRPRIIKKQVYRDWEDSAIAQLWLQKAQLDMREPIDEFVWVTFLIYLKTSRTQYDMLNMMEGPADVLQSAGILKNDNLIRNVDESGIEYNVPDGQERVEMIIRPFELPKIRKVEVRSIKPEHLKSAETSEDKGGYLPDARILEKMTKDLAASLIKDPKEYKPHWFRD